MDKTLFETLINFGMPSVLLAVVLFIAIKAGNRAFKWFTSEFLKDLQEQRSKEMAALIGEFKAMRENFTKQIGRLIEHTDDAARIQAENEQKVVEAIGSVKSEIKDGFTKLEFRINDLENRVKTLESIK